MKDESGSAFPRVMPTSDKGTEYVPGLTKREYFSAMAIQGLVVGCAGLRRKALEVMKVVNK